jgi:adenosylcobinamide-GDP ribazoletransferase
MPDAPPSPSPALESRAGTNTPAALLAQLATAVRFLTVVPVRGATVPIGQSALFFPLVGLGLGAVLVAADRTLALAVPEAVRAVLLVALLAGATGALHLDGLADSADALLTRERERALAIMRDTATGAFGVAAIVLVVLVKVRSLDALPVETRTTALLMAPMLARWAMVVLAFGSRPARPDGLGFAMVGSLKFREFGVATVFALWVALAATAARGLTAFILIAALTITIRILAHRKLGGITGDHLGAVAELTEALVLAVFTVGVRAGG